MLYFISIKLQMYIMRIYFFIILIGLSLGSPSYAWWATGHALIAQIAENNLSPKTKLKVIEYLNVHPDIPTIDKDQSVTPLPEALYLASNYIAFAATWPDAIKDYEWKSKELKTKYSNVHFLDIPIDLKNHNHPNYCSNYINIPLIKKVSKNKINAITAIQSSIKSLISDTISINEKATALRYLLHLVGDIHQPFHIADPVWKNINTYGANLVKFDIYYQKDIPNYTRIADIDNKKDVLIPSSNLHSYTDAIVGLYYQLPEPLNGIYDKDGFNLWVKNKENYIKYLNKISESLSITDTTDPDIFNWIQNTAMIGCNISLDKVMHYSIATDNKFINLHISPKSFDEKYSNIIKNQISLGGIRLAYLLEAIFNPKTENSITKTYYKNIVEPIKNDSNIKTLSKLSESQDEDLIIKYYKKIKKILSSLV